MDSYAAARDSTSLRGIVEILLRDKWTVVVVTFLCVATAATAALLTPRKYTATVILSVVSNRGGGGLGAAGGSILSQVGGIASIAGLGLRGDTEKAEPVAVLESQTLTTRYIQEHNLLPILFPKQWDPVAKSWRVSDARDTPTLWRANEKFKNSVREITESTKTGLITLAITWTDPKLAAQWANDLVKLTNDQMRERAISDSERNIAYLKQQAAQTDIAQVRTAVYAILESEIRRAMLARGTDEYALKVLDSAVAPEIPSAPKRTIWVSVGLVLGLFLSVFVVLARESWVRSGRS